LTAQANALAILAGEIQHNWRDRAYRQHDAGMLSVRVDPLLENLRKDSRYKAILVRMKLDDDPSARGL
jgi:hypothetical protein